MKFYQGLSLTLFTLLFFTLSSARSQTVTLVAGQEDYSTSANITADEDGIISSLVGSDGDLNTIQNSHIISTGDAGAFSSAYGIKVSGDYNAVTNHLAATIETTGSSGRGISMSDYSTVTNAGTITTAGSTSYGIYAGGDGNILDNAGLISTAGSSSHGLYANGNSNVMTNSATITTAKGYGIFLNGNDNQVTNSGTIMTTEGSSAYGIYISAGSDMFATSSYYSTIVNSNMISSSAHGIYAKDDYVDISNSGTITTSDGTSIYGVKLEGDNSTLTNSGTMNATNYAIYNTGSGTVINNLGTVNAGIYIGDGVLNILGGTISGEVNGVSGVGNIVIGSATYSAITFNQAADFIDLASLTISNSSILNANNAVTATSIVVGAGSTLNLNNGAAITAAISGESDGVGSLNILDDFSFTDEIGVAGHSLAIVDIASGGSLSTTENIYATDVRVSGMFDLSSMNSLSIFGNLAGTGSANIKVGSNNQTITGDFTLTSGDILSLGFSDGNVGGFLVTGKANIDSHAKLAITANSNQGYIANGTQLNIITAGSGSSIHAIDDANIDVNGGGSNIFGLLQYRTQVSANNLVLEVNRVAAEDVTDNKNAQNIYKNINVIGASSSDELLQTQKYLDVLDAGGSEVTQALRQLLPQSSKANLDITRNLANSVSRIAMSRLQKVKVDVTKSSWAQLFGKAVIQDEIGSDEGYNANSIGMIFGSDQNVFNILSLGSSLSYARTDVKSADSLKKNIIDSVQINFYGTKEVKDYFTTMLIGFAWNQFSSNRSIEIVGSNATARFNGQTYLARLQSGFRKNLGNNLNITPEFSLNFVQNNIAGYSENGANSLNLDVGEVSSKFLEARIGLNLDWSVKIPGLREFEKVNLSSEISYGHDFIADIASTTNNFSSQESAFDTQVSDVDSQNIRLDLKAAIYYLEDSKISLDYSLDHRKTAQSHLISLQARQAF